MTFFFEAAELKGYARDRGPQSQLLYTEPWPKPGCLQAIHVLRHSQLRRVLC